MATRSITPSNGGAPLTWTLVTEPEPSELADLAARYHLDPLLLEDAVTAQHRAKADIAPDRLFLLLKVLTWVDETSDVETGQVAVFTGPGYAIAICMGTELSPADIDERLGGLESPASIGHIAVAWAIADLVVDGYLEVGESIQDDIEEIEQMVFSPDPVTAADRIYRLNRESIEMRRAVRPLLVPAGRLANGTLVPLPEEVRPLVRDVSDHVLRANDMVDSFDSVLMTLLMASTARQDLRQNEDMRRIAAWAAIIAVPTAIAGIYGMNFEDMPELHWAFGYPAVLALMAVICLLLYRGFRRSGWI